MCPAKGEMAAIALHTFQLLCVGVGVCVGYSGTRSGGPAGGEYAGRRWDQAGGMTEQEQLDQALRNSLNDAGIS